jgi:hypothetical protein
MEYVGLLVQLAISIAVIAGFWKVFTKAGQPGWASLVPFYNAYVMVQIAGKPTWWMILFFIPVANVIALFVVSIGIAEKFGKGTGYGVGLALLSFIFYPMLGFSDAQYNPNA